MILGWLQGVVDSILAVVLATFNIVNKAYLKKIGVRFLIVNVVYAIIKLTVDHSDDPKGWLDPASVFYYASAIFLFFATWEFNDRIIARYQRKAKDSLLGSREYQAIIGWTLVFMIPISALCYYLGIFHINGVCQPSHTANPWLQWRIDFFRAMLLGITVIFFNVFYHAFNQKKELQSKMTSLKKEVVTSKYKSLKSQISPHFLFNSLNTLTSLMYEDRDLASDFVSRLASCYRYILDNREADLVSLENELAFLDSFMFMMKIRHEGAMEIKTDIGVDPSQYLIPTLTLQMLVENAMKHNLYSKERPMKIVVRTKGTQRLIVENTYRKRELEEPSTQLGIKNIQRRYGFYTNQEVLVETTADLFSIEIPLLPKHEKEIQLTQIS